MRIITFILVALVCFQCINDDLNYDTFEPVLQLDATFYANDSLPEIQLTQSFLLNGRTLNEIPESEIYVSGAQIALFWNGEKMEIEERAAGYYKIISNDLVKLGDVFEIEVTHDNHTISAKATVPNVPIEMVSLQSQNATKLKRTQFSKSTNPKEKIIVWIGNPFIKIDIPFVPENFKLDISAINTCNGVPSYMYYPSNGWKIKGFTKYDFQGFNTITLYNSLALCQTDSAKSEGAKAIITINLEMVTLGAEFKDWRAIPSNVINGIGRFTGAVRYTKDFEIPLDAVYIEEE
jgi:hypothetical protein